MKLSYVDEMSNMLVGPDDNYQLPKESLGKIIFDRLRNSNSDTLLNVDPLTNEFLTSGRLLEESVRTTNIFIKLGIEKGDVIAIICENSINYMIPAVAAFYMGIAVNTVNPGYSVDELKRGLSLTKPKLVLCSDEVLNTFLKIKEEVGFVETVLLMGSIDRNQFNRVERFEDLLQRESAVVNDFQPTVFDWAEQVALIGFSSGTTGFSKAVLLTHKNIWSSIGLLSDPNYGNATREDATIIVVPFFHIFGSLLQILTVITSMKSVILRKFVPDVFLSCIHVYKVSKLYLVPSLVLFLNKSPLVNNYDTSSLRDIVCGTAPLSKELATETIKRFKVTLTHLYGLTETAGPITFRTNSKDIGSVGYPAPGVTIKISNTETGDALGPYERGEICMKGSMIMKGYIPAIEFMDPTDGYLHTGDLGYYDKNGAIYVVGRLKEIIKYKGFQVPPAELEALIVTHPLVADCGVIGVPDERAGEIPLAFVVLKSNANISEQAIIDFVAERISIQKRLYGGVKFVESIPKNPAGKIMRRVLTDIVQRL